MTEQTKNFLMDHADWLRRNNYLSAAKAIQELLDNNNDSEETDATN